MTRRITCSLLVILLVLLRALQLPAAPTDQTLARQAVRGWLSQNPHPMGLQLTGQIDRIETYLDADNEPAYHIVYLLPEGLVIVAGDDEVEPVIGFVKGSEYNPASDNPLAALVESDVRGRVDHVRSNEPRQVLLGQSVEAQLETVSRERHQAKWAELVTSDPAPSLHNEQESDVSLAPTSIPDVWVAPFVQTRWNQSKVCNQNTYNYYTPNNYVCGCGATAFAQILRYFEHPSSGIGINTFNITINGSGSSRSTRGGNGSGGAYNWSDMVYEPDCDTTISQRQAIGALCYDAGISLNMSYTSGGSGSIMLLAKDRLLDTFGYSNAVKGYNNNANIGAGLIGMINPNLDAGLPVMLGIFGDGGHAILTDGYGYNGSTMYHHLNMGWGGYDDAWYNLPAISTSSYTFNSVEQTVYNIFISGSGEIISGRVTDGNGDPVNGVVVTASRSGGGSYSDTTDSKGIYAIAQVPSNSSYTLSAAKSGYQFTSQSVTTGNSSDYANSSGNSWGNDFTGNYAPDPSISINKGTYNRGESIIVTIADGPGNTYDWLGIFADGADDNSYLCYLYTDGTKTGSADVTDAAVTFSSNITGLLPAGDYNVRFFSNTHQLLASEDFTVTTTGPTLSTSKSSYARGESVVATFANAPGLKHDWIGLFTDNAPDNAPICWLYSDGSKTGVAGLINDSVTFSAAHTGMLSAGDYNIRMFAGGSQTCIASNDFTVTATGPAISTNKSSYSATESIVVTFANAPGNKYDWIGLYQSGAQTINYRDYLFTDDSKNGTAGQYNGSVTFATNYLESGNYEVRLHANGSGMELATDTFSVSGSAPVISADKSTYSPGETITVSYSNAPGYQYDWIGIFQEGDPALSYQDYLYTDNTKSGTASNFNGTVTFTTTNIGILSPGNYETRLYCNGSSSQLASDTFTVSGSLPAVTTGKGTYEPAEVIDVTISDALGNKYDWVGLFNAGDPATSHLDYRYSDGTRRGTAGVSDNTVYFSPVTHGVLSTGNYEVRFYANGSTKLLDSAAITIAGSNPTLYTSKDTYAVNELIQVDFANASRMQYDWIGLFNNGDPVTSHLNWRRTDNTQNGTAGIDDGTVTFSAGLDAAGTYEARLYADGGSQLLASYTFTVSGSAPAISTNKGTYEPAEVILITISDAPGNKYDWVGLFNAGDPPNSHLDYRYTDGTRRGADGITDNTIYFSPVTHGLLTAGNYEVRFYSNGSTNLLDTVAITVAGSNPSVTTNKDTYSTGEQIQVNFANASRVKNDWIGLFNAGDPVGSHIQWLRTDNTKNGTDSIASGTVTFSGGLPGVGTYEARLYADGGSWLLDSYSFTVE